MSTTPIIILDTETHAKKNQIPIEVAYIGISMGENHQFRVESEFCQRYNPGEPIQFGAMATHHILDEDVAACPPASDFVLPEGTKYMIGHSIEFDWDAIGQPDVKLVDTLGLSRVLWPECDSHSQSALMYFFDRHKAREMTREAHSALADVKMNLYILNRICERLKPKSMRALWVESLQALIPKTINFGKHEGALFKDVPQSYKNWYYDQDNPDKYVVMAMKGQNFDYLLANTATPVSAPAPTPDDESDDAACMTGNFAGNAP